MMIAFEWSNIMPKTEANMGTMLFTIGILYGSVGFYPQKLKYIIPIFAFLKLLVFKSWAQKGCQPDKPNDASMTIAIGDLSFAVLFIIAFYKLYKADK